MNDFILTLCGESRGGLRDSFVVEEGRPLGGYVRVVFIHGFNVDRERAIFQADTLWGNLFKGALMDRVQKGVYLWPSVGFRWRILSKITYPAMVGRAERAGRQLGNYLTGRNGSEVVLVGHSLGSAVALAAADRLQGAGTLRGLVLLGAAVDVNEMVGGGQFSRPQLALREAVEYSPDDKVLRSVFKIGQKLADPYAPLVEAVGLSGQPWSRGWQHRDCKFDHHTHWEVPATAQAVAWAMDHSVSGRVPATNVAAERTPAVREVE
ncbi:alpha/beta fold hydrolase [Amycolatopsis sp. NPDC049252]|uniref:alpha/beta fold hydrolase n=1 Tax=Amycolatopsis sp. NPDC049252 TaxID=3363933 RepID=UPI00371765E4